MTRDFLKPQKATGLDTNAPVGKRSRFAPDPFPTPLQPKPKQPDLQTLIQRGLRLGDPMAKAWANVQPTVQRQAMPEEEKEENLQTKQESTVQRQELEEEETLQTKSEPSLQREELPEEEDKTLQMQSERDVQLKCQDCEQEQAEVQTKLTIGQPGDKYEQEADNMAAQVMSMPDPTAQNVQRQETEEEETLQPKPLTDSITPVVQRQTSETQPQDNASQSLESQLAAEKGSGSPLSDEVRGFMEPRFGADFSEVRVHTGSAAVQMNQQLGAQAFTHGNDIYYGKGKAPGNDALTAHELTHTIQQQSIVQRQVQTYGTWKYKQAVEESIKTLTKNHSYKVFLSKKVNDSPVEWKNVKAGDNVDNKPINELGWSIKLPNKKDWDWIPANNVALSKFKQFERMELPAQSRTMLENDALKWLEVNSIKYEKLKPGSREFNPAIKVDFSKIVSGFDLFYQDRSHAVHVVTPKLAVALVRLIRFLNSQNVKILHHRGVSGGGGHIKYGNAIDVAGFTFNDNAKVVKILLADNKKQSAWYDDQSKVPTPEGEMTARNFMIKVGQWMAQNDFGQVLGPGVPRHFNHFHAQISRGKKYKGFVSDLNSSK